MLEHINGLIPRHQEIERERLEEWGSRGDEGGGVWRVCGGGGVCGGVVFELQVTQVKKLSLQSFSWVLPYSQANNHLPLIQFIRKSCLLYIYNTPKFQPFLTFSTTVERTPEWSLKCTSFHVIPLLRTFRWLVALKVKLQILMWASNALCSGPQLLLFYFITLLFGYCTLSILASLQFLKAGWVHASPSGFCTYCSLACNTLPLGSPKARSSSPLLFKYHLLRESFSDHSIKNDNPFFPPAPLILPCFLYAL